MIQKNRFHQFLVQVPLLSITKKYTTFYQPRVFNFRVTDLITYNYCSITLFHLWWRLLAWFCWNKTDIQLSVFVRLLLICQGIATRIILWGGKFWSSDWWSRCQWLLCTFDLIDDTAWGKAFSFFISLSYSKHDMTMRITRMMTMILWTGGRENFLIVRFLRDALDCIWCAVNRITVDQHDGQLHPFDQLHLHHQHHVTFATNTFWATSWSWLGILLLTCQRGKSRKYLQRICHISGRQREMLTHCTSWQQNFYVRVKYHFILDWTLWMELWD